MKKKTNTKSRPAGRSRADAMVAIIEAASAVLGRRSRGVYLAIDHDAAVPTIRKAMRALQRMNDVLVDRLLAAKA